MKYKNSAVILTGLDCLRTFTCQQSYDESVSSVPVNVTVTTSPNNQFGLVDFHIQWDDSENDGM